MNDTSAKTQVLPTESKRKPPTKSTNQQWTSISHLVPAMEDRAVSFFCMNYFAGECGPVQLFMDHIPSLHANDNIEEHLMASMKAVGFASLSHLSNSSLLMTKAIKSYTQAIRLVNIALETADTAKKDSTLLSIMILTIFEHTIGCHSRSVAACEKHINGSAALLDLRGREQLRSLTGRRLFQQTSSTLLFSCIQRHMAMPQHVLDLRNILRSFADTTSPAWRLQECAILFAEFRAKMREGRLLHAGEILQEALSLDNEFASIFHTVEPAWQFETLYTEANPDVIFNGFYHVYRDFQIAQIWNAWRVCRILLHEIIQDVLQHAPTATATYSNQTSQRIVADEQYRKSTTTLRELRSDILASVPQHIAYPPTRNPSSPSSSPFPRPNISDTLFDLTTLDRPSKPRPQIPQAHHTPILRSGGGHFLIWPLYLTGTLQISTGSERKWIANCLRYVGRSAAVQRATLLADLLEGKQTPEGDFDLVAEQHPCTSPRWELRGGCRKNDNVRKRQE